MADDSDEEEHVEKLPSTKQMLEALQVLRKEIQQRGDSDVFEQHRAYEELIMKLTKEGKIQSNLDEFLSKIN